MGSGLPGRLMAALCRKRRCRWVFLFGTGGRGESVVERPAAAAGEGGGRRRPRAWPLRGGEERGRQHPPPPQQALPDGSRSSGVLRPGGNRGAGPLGSVADWSAGRGGCAWSREGARAARGRRRRGHFSLAMSSLSPSVLFFDKRARRSPTHLLGRLAAEARALAVRLIGRRLRHVLARRLHGCRAGGVEEVAVSLSRLFVASSLHDRRPIFRQYASKGRAKGPGMARSCSGFCCARAAPDVGRRRRRLDSGGGGEAAAALQQQSGGSSRQAARSSGEGSLLILAQGSSQLAARRGRFDLQRRAIARRRHHPRRRPPPPCSKSRPPRPRAPGGTRPTAPARHVHPHPPAPSPR
jgi:hypothetical protein